MTVEGLAARLAAGAVCGLAWAAGLRGAMAALSGVDSNVTWAGTFVWILLPGAVVGILLGWAEHIRRTGGRRRWRWLALSPMLLAAALFSDPAGLALLLEEGLGGGALAVPLLGMLGGYALSRRGRLWPRLLARTVFFAPIPAGAFAVFMVDPITPYGAWMGLYFYSFLIVLAFGCAIPHQPVKPNPQNSRPTAFLDTATR
jgi:hypothetical protein